MQRQTLYSKPYCLSNQCCWYQAINCV